MSYEDDEVIGFCIQGYPN